MTHRDDPLPLGARVILLGIYRGSVHAHRPPGIMVKLDVPLGPSKVVMAASADVRVDPDAPPRTPPQAKHKPPPPKRNKP